MAETREKEPQKRKQEEVEAKILEVAINLFARKGFEGASVRDITAAAQVTVPTLYYHFKDKDGLYQAALKESAENLLELLKKVDDPNASLRDRFIALAKAKMRLAIEKDLGIKLLTKEWIDSGSSQDLPPQLEAVLGESFKYMEEMIAQAVQRGEISPVNPKIGVWYLIGLIFLRNGRFLPKFMKAREAISDDEIEEFVDLILKGLEKK
ncbi:TetR/AcrR family transcriptional regulator [candidate division WOR-3 bacterium]|nr:TetR/AcrR family transcriptional regulator [candidate division WOR-3 bacterium]